MSKRTTKKIAGWILMSAMLATAGISYGQQAGKAATEPAQAQPQASPSGQTEAVQEERNFQLIFTAREVDENGKVVNSRRFDTTVTTWSPKSAGIANIRSGVKIPVPTGANSSQFTYMDVGANFDVNRARVVKGNRLSMQVSAEISGADTAASDSSRMPIRQNRWMGDVEVPIGGRKVIFSSDDLSSKKTLQIELAVVPVDR
jgi:hypothetical protein